MKIEKIIYNTGNKNPSSVIGKDLKNFIEVNDLKTVKVVFEIIRDAKTNYVERIRIGVKNTNELVKIIEFFGMRGKEIKIKTIETSEVIYKVVKDYPNFYLISINVILT